MILLSGRERIIDQQEQAVNCSPEYAYATDGNEDAHDNWPCHFMHPFSETIYAGSTEIQKNIIGERVLGLPKEVCADRMARERV